MQPHRPPYDPESERLAKEEWRAEVGEARRKRLPPLWVVVVVVVAIAVVITGVAIYQRDAAVIRCDFAPCVKR